MDMNLVMVFAFVATLVLIITTGIILFPISRKLGYFLEQAARERAERLADATTQASLPSPQTDQMIELMSSLQSQIGQLAERQAFTEHLLEERQQQLGPDGEGEA